MKVFPRRSSRSVTGKGCFQQGWALLESAVALALLGAIAVLVLSTFDAVGGREESMQSAEELERAEDAIFGFALTRFRFPAPVDAHPSPGRPGVVEGWFPVAATGMSLSRRIRYAVDESLIDVPVDLYRPDLLRLGGDPIAPRTAVNGLDFCVSLLAKNRSAAVSSDATHMAFALQAAIGDATPPLRVDGDGSGAASTGPRLEIRMRGHGESAAHLGCLDKLSGLAVAVKATAVGADLGKLAAQDVAFKELLVASAEQSLANLEWQEANLAASMTRYALDEVQNLIQLKSTPIGLAKGVGTMVTIAAAMAANAISISQTRTGRAAAAQDIPQARRTLDLAVRYRREIEAMTRSQAARAHRLLQQG